MGGESFIKGTSLNLPPVLGRPLPAGSKLVQRTVGCLSGGWKSTGSTPPDAGALADRGVDQAVRGGLSGGRGATPPRLSEPAIGTSLKRQHKHVEPPFFAERSSTGVHSQAGLQHKRAPGVRVKPAAAIGACRLRWRRASSRRWRGLQQCQDEHRHRSTSHIEGRFGPCCSPKQCEAVCRQGAFRVVARGIGGECLSRVIRLRWHKLAVRPACNKGGVTKRTPIMVQ